MGTEFFIGQQRCYCQNGNKKDSLNGVKPGRESFFFNGNRESEKNSHDRFLTFKVVSDTVFCIQSAGEKHG